MTDQYLECIDGRLQRHSLFLCLSRPVYSFSSDVRNAAVCLPQARECIFELHS